MTTVTVRQARENLSSLLDEAMHGQTVTITRRGKEVARLVPPEKASNGSFPDMTEFRKRMKKSVKGESLSETILKMRNEERF